MNLLIAHIAHEAPDRNTNRPWSDDHISYELLAGRKTFSGPTLMAVLNALANQSSLLTQVDNARD